MSIITYYFIFYKLMEIKYGENMKLNCFAFLDCSTGSVFHVCIPIIGLLSKWKSIIQHLKTHIYIDYIWPKKKGSFQNSKPKLTYSSKCLFSPEIVLWFLIVHVFLNISHEFTLPYPTFQDRKMHYFYTNNTNW